MGSHGSHGPEEVVATGRARPPHLRILTGSASSGSSGSTPTTPCLAVPAGPRGRPRRAVIGSTSSARPQPPGPHVLYTRFSGSGGSTRTGSTPPCRHRERRPLPPSRQKRGPGTPPCNWPLARHLVAIGAAQLVFARICDPHAQRSTSRRSFWPTLPTTRPSLVVHPTAARTWIATCTRWTASRRPARVPRGQVADQLKGRVAQREHQNGLIWLLIDYFARFLREGHDKPQAARAETVERLPHAQDGRGWRPPAPTHLSRLER
jgi:hypothetical protein